MLTTYKTTENNVDKDKLIIIDKEEGTSGRKFNGKEDLKGYPKDRIL